MELTRLCLLKRVFECYDDQGYPVSVAVIASPFESDRGTVRTHLAWLERHCLVSEVEQHGYRPTITARELLELEPEDDELLILDPCPEE